MVVELWYVELVLIEFWKKKQCDNEKCWPAKGKNNENNFMENTTIVTHPKSRLYLEMMNSRTHDTSIYM
jgi:hypothetical protein